MGLMLNKSHKRDLRTPTDAYRYFKMPMVRSIKISTHELAGEVGSESMRGKPAAGLDTGSSSVNCKPCSVKATPHRATEQARPRLAERGRKYFFHS